MRHLWSGRTRPALWSCWLIVLAIGLALSAAPLLAAPLPDNMRTAAADVAPQTEPPCQQCHPDEYAQWQAAPHASAMIDPAFQEQLQLQHNQEACLQCHTSGLDIGTESGAAAGVTCEACHGPYKEGHPSAETMQLPMASETCRTCHLATFVEWESSSHGQANIECFDCHLAHSQGLRTGSEETLCVACHELRDVDTLHMTHRIDGLTCSGCHMSDQMSGAHDTATVQVSGSTHDFDISSAKCLECHTETLSASADISTMNAVAASAATDGAKLVAETARANALADQVQQLEGRFVGLRNAAIIGMGLALGVGGFVGLAAGLAGMALLRRQRAPEEDQS